MADYREEDYSTDYPEQDAFNEMFTNPPEDEDEGDYVYPSGFDRMSEQDRYDKYGQMNFQGVLDDLSSLIYDSRKAFLRRNKKIIDAREADGLIDELKARLPREIEDAREIIRDRDGIITDAEDNAAAIRSDANAYDDDVRTAADNYNADMHQKGDDYYDKSVQEGNDEKAAIIEAARRQAEQMVSEHQITLDAQAQRRQILDKATEDARALTNQVALQIEDHKTKINNWANNEVASTCDYCYKLLIATMEILNGNVSENQKSVEQIKDFMRSTSARYEQVLAQVNRNNGGNNA